MSLIYRGTSLSLWVVTFILTSLGSDSFGSERIKLNGNSSFSPTVHLKKNTENFYSRQTLQLESHQYLSPMDGTDILRDEFLLFQSAYKKETAFRRKLSFAALQHTHFKDSSFYLNEAYLGYQFSPAIHIDIGRKKQDWALFDSDWNLGLWEPQSNWDPLRPFEQGLSGVFLNFETEFFDLHFFGSPLFIPTLGPEIAEKDGALVSQSRWHRTPITSGEVLNRETRFYYSLEIPTITELAQQTSQAVKTNIRLGHTGFWTSFAISEKPLNPLSVRYDYNLAVSQGSSQAEINVVPTVSYHKLQTIELGWKKAASQIYISFFKDETRSPLPINARDSQGEKKTDWLQQSPQDLLGSSFTWRDQVPLFFLDAPINFSLSLLSIENKPNKDVNDLGQEKGQLLPDRFNWTKAIQGQIQAQYKVNNFPIHTQFRTLREIEQKGILVSLHNQLVYNQRLSFQFGVDILGNEGAENELLPSGFFKQFRTNDRIHGGLTYVF